MFIGFCGPALRIHVFVYVAVKCLPILNVFASLGLCDAFKK